MSFETHPRYWFTEARFRTAFLLSGTLVLFALAFAAGRLGYQPSWVFAVAALASLLPLLLRKFPILLMLGLTFVGQFKTKSAAGFSVTDPTFVTLALLSAALAVQLLLTATGAERLTLRDVFRGQALGVCAFFLLLLVIAISYVYTPAPGVGGAKILKLFVFDALAFVAPLILLQDEKDVGQFVLFTTLASLALAFFTLYRLLHPTAALLRGDQDATQIGAGLLMDAAILILLYYPVKRGGASRAGALLSLGVLSLGVAASLSRSAVLSLLLVASVGTLFIGLDSRVASRKTILLAAAACLLIPSMAFLWVRELPAASSKLAEKAQELVMIFQGSGPSGTAQQRLEFTGSAWRAFLSKPLLGWGAGGWSTLWHYSESRVVVTYPHNFILEIAAEQGLAGLLPLGVLFLAILRSSRDILQARAGQLAFIVPVVALNLLSACVTGSVESRDLWSWCGVLFAFSRMARMPYWQGSFRRPWY